MRRYRLIEHTADIGLVAYGNTLKEAYENAGIGLFSILTDLKKLREAESRTIELNENDADSLLFEWMNSLIFLFEVDKLLFKRFDIIGLDESHLKAICHGEKYNPSRHTLNTGIKSATYHMLKVDKDKNRVQVIFDI